MCQVIAKILKGYKVVYENKTYEVLGSLCVRGKTSYVVKDVNGGNKMSFQRETLLKLQAAGKAVVTS